MNAPAVPIAGQSDPATPGPRPAPRRGIVIREHVPWPPWLRHLIATGSFAILVVGWEIGVRAGWIDPFFWSSPSQVLATGYVFVTSGSALYDTVFTVESTLLGFAIGTVAGAAIGLSLWWSRNAASIVEGYLVLFNAIPKIALAPLLILVFGIGLSSKVALAASLTVVVTALAAHAGVREVDPDLVRMMFSLGARRRDIFFKVVVPSSLPWIASSLRINIGLALSGSIVGEFISSRYGLGKMILYAGTTYEMALIWVGIVILSVVALAMLKGVELLEGLLLRGVHATRRS